jgi:putative flippase GtrA
MPTVFFAPDHLARIAKQFTKFFVVGVLNTGIDFAIFNTEMWLSGIHSGRMLVVFNILSFSVAVTNSYFMNKRWTFEGKQVDGDAKEAVKLSQFVGVSLVGMSINSLIIYVFTAFIPAMFGLSPQLWVNVAKIFATGASMIWNFVGYKLWVFKK